MLGRRAVVLGVALLALCVCVSVRLLSGSAPVLLAGEVAGGAGGGGLLSKELAQDARMLATLSRPPGRIAQAGWGGEAAKHGSAAHTRERHEMMSRYGAVPASWCAPVRPPLLRMHSCTHLAGTSVCQDTVGSADIGIQLGTFLRVWRAHH